MFGIDIHLHPAVVHFPIALFISALLFELMCWITRREVLHQTAFCLYILAVIVTPLVVWTGLQEAQEHKIHHPVLDTHQRFAYLTMWTSLLSLPILWLFKKKITPYFRVVFLILLAMIVASVSLAAYNGGRLVYEYGIGVES